VPGFYVENFGCRAARADGEAIGERLRSAGHCVGQPSQADVLIVNTCSVTAEADREARAYIRRVHRQNPGARILVTGCYAQRAPEELAELDGVAAVVGNSHKAFIPWMAADLMQTVSRNQSWEGAGFGPYPGSGNIDRASAPAAPLVSIRSLLRAGTVPIFADDLFAHSFLEEAQVLPGEQTRPNLKIQEGCGNRCTFCVIPLTRGSSRSLPADAVLKQIDGFVAAGGNELVLSGINLGRWGRDLTSGTSNTLPTLSSLLPQTRKDGAPARKDGAANVPGARLAWLLQRIFEETDLPRLRLSSIEPMDWDDELMALMAEHGGGPPGSPATGLPRWGARLCRHAHLPLQSGSDAVLRRMHRRYRPWHYAEKIAALVRAAGPELTLGADVMVGFPGESDREFEETLELVRSLPFGYLHLFPFSPRPGTCGWALHAESPVPHALVEERMATLRALAAEKMCAHREQFAGQTLDAITLHTGSDLAPRGRTRALSENFLPVEIADSLPSNRLVRVRCVKVNAQSIIEAELECENGGRSILIESTCPATTNP
jgi:threonylcarbamoyladenosine tRNA methylthiotransferase MtaB